MQHTPDLATLSTAAIESSPSAVLALLILLTAPACLAFAFVLLCQAHRKVGEDRIMRAFIDAFLGILVASCAPIIWILLVPTAAVLSDLWS